MLRAALEVLKEPGAGSPLKLAVYSRTVPRRLAPGAAFRAMPTEAAPAAHELFSVLRELDDQGAHLIWVEEPPDTPDWDGVRDRLQRAAAA
jgi:L-threonylcarbamoyladenylate synthase